MAKTMDLGPGYHVCSLYLTDEECLHTAERFLEPGLSRGDKCLVLAERRLGQDLKTRLSGLSPARRTGRRAQLEVLATPGPTAISKASGACFTASMLRDRIISAMDSGFVRLRVAVIPSRGCIDSSHVDGLMACEQELYALTAELPVAILCQYGMALLGPGMLLDLLRAHPHLMIGGHVCRNLQYASWEELSAGPRKRAQMQVDRCLCEALEYEQMHENIRRVMLELEERNAQVAKLNLLLEKAASMNLEIAEPVLYLLSSIRYLRSNLASCDEKISLHLEAVAGAAEYISAALERMAWSLSPRALEQEESEGEVVHIHIESPNKRRKAA